MKNDMFSTKKSLTGGLLGALAGTIASTLTHKAYDKPVKKAAKTGLFAAMGFLIGGWLENVFHRK
jgi:uncharacterized membrane protein YebE (DUF533 family)